MEPRVTVRQIGGKQLLGSARSHSIVTDRPFEQGGTDLGFTSGEMLLLAIGSCAAGSLRNYFEVRGAPCQRIRADVFFEPTVPGARDRVVIELELPESALAVGAEAIRNAALSGGVASRVRLGSEIDVRFSRTAVSQDK
ncbi:MAG: OsmC family protein [Burkholderiales bacterium]